MLSLTFTEVCISLVIAGVIFYLIPYLTVLGLFIIGLIITIITDTIARIKKLFGKSKKTKKSKEEEEIDE